MLYILKISFTGVVVLRMPLCTFEVKSCYVSYNCNLCLFFLISLVGWVGWCCFFLEFSTGFNLFLFDWNGYLVLQPRKNEIEGSKILQLMHLVHKNVYKVYKVCINKSNRFFATFREVTHPRRWWQRELKKVINGLISNTATLHKHAAKFSLQLFRGRHCDYNVKLHSVRFHRGRLNNTNN